MKQTYFLICLLLVVASLAVPGAARGGRGRGGGSFGGLFGGWRSKYGSKSSSSGSGRRVVSGSPMHTSMTVPKLPPPPPQPAKAMSQPKPQLASYPRQQLPPGYNHAAAPGQGTYYANAQALPAGAVYYAQPPMSMGSGTSGFLTGMLAGRMMDNVLFGHRHHVSHIYHQNQQGEAAASGAGREIIIINNGQPQGEGQTQPPLSEALSPEEAVSTEESEQEGDSDASEETAHATAMPAPPVGSIVCFPIMLNETDPTNADLVREVERVVCFPTPTTEPQMAPVDCQSDPVCLLEQASGTTTVPPIVAGDIGGATEASDSLEASSPASKEAASQD